MKFNWKKILSPKESVQKEFGISNGYCAIIIIISLLAALVASSQSSPLAVTVFIFLLGLCYSLYLKKSRHYAFTDKRIIIVDSFVGTNITSIDYSQITDIEIDQSFIDQIAGWGNLTINTAGTHTPQITLSFIDNPQSLKQALDQIRDGGNNIL